MAPRLAWLLFLVMASVLGFTLFVVCWLLGNLPTLAFAGALGLTLAGFACVSLAGYITAPLDDLRRVAIVLSGGDLRVRVNSGTQDVIGDLGRALDRMAEQLTERIARMRAEEARLATIIDAMVEGVLVTDSKGTIQLTNKALLALAGREVRGFPVRDAIRSIELREALTTALGGVFATVSFDVQTNLEKRRLTAQLVPLREGGGVIAVLHDVTELHRVDAVRRDFVANASHELRTPLTTIRGFAETLLDGAIEDPVLARRFVQTINDNSVRLQSLVDDLLELSRAESPDAQLELEPVSSLETAERVAASLLPRAEGRKTTITVAGDADSSWCVAEPRALEHVLTNLIENAIKYSGENGRIHVGIEAMETKLTICVRDNGPGISREHLPRLFERFYRVDEGRARAQGGTGLGLSIVKHLVTRMGGAVEVDSVVGEGTTFTVTLLRPRVSDASWNDQLDPLEDV